MKFEHGDSGSKFSHRWSTSPVRNRLLAAAASFKTMHTVISLVKNAKIQVRCDSGQVNVRNLHLVPGNFTDPHREIGKQGKLRSSRCGGFYSMFATA